jgi:hypothetical protein
MQAIAGKWMQRVNITSHTDDGKDKFLMVVAIRDVHSGDILGYSFDHSENRRVYENAMAMAVQKQVILPYEIVTDRFPGHNTSRNGRTICKNGTLGVHIEFSRS